VTRVAITTNIDRYAEPAAELERVGLEPVRLPCIEIKEVPGAADRARAASAYVDLVVITSSRSLELVWGSGPLPSVQFAAVGPATAAAIDRRGGRVGTIGEGGALLLAQRLAGEVATRRVLYLHAHGSDQAAMRLLENRAAGFSAVEVYRSVPVGPAADPVEAVIFASLSAVEGWLSARSLAGVVVGAIGATTSAGLKRHGRRPDVLAPAPSFTALVDALAAFLEEAT